MREALSVYAEYMQRKASETVPKEGESIAKKPRTENSDSNNTSVPSTSEIVVLRKERMRERHRVPQKMRAKMLRLQRQ